MRRSRRCNASALNVSARSIVEKAIDGGVEIREYREDAGEGASRDRATTFATLADGHLDEAYRLARLIVGDASEAEDATHDAFVAAWRGWGRLRDPGRFDAWFGRILVNTCRNRCANCAGGRSLMSRRQACPEADGED